jgi:hypothetical protein
LLLIVRNPQSTTKTIISQRPIIANIDKNTLLKVARTILGKEREHGRC